MSIPGGENRPHGRQTRRNPEKRKEKKPQGKQTESIFGFLKNKYNVNRFFYFLTDTDGQKLVSL